MRENEIGTIVVDAAVAVRKELGPGLLETVYEVVVETVKTVQKKQLQTYLRLTGCKPGYLLNFGAALVKNGISRTVKGLVEQQALCVSAPLRETKLFAYIGL